MIDHYKYKIRSVELFFDSSFEFVTRFPYVLKRSEESGRHNLSSARQRLTVTQRGPLDVFAVCHSRDKFSIACITTRPTSRMVGQEH